MKKLHIAYFSITALADCDLPLLKEMQQWADVDYYIPMTGKYCQSVMFNVNVKQTCGLYRADNYPELAFLSDWISPNRVFILNMPKPHDYSPGNLFVIWKCMRQMKKESYDLIHVTMPLRYGFYPLYLFRSKMVLTVHDPIPHSGNGTLQNSINRRVAFSMIHNMILLNKAQRKEFAETYRIDERHIFQSHLGIYHHLKHIKPSEQVVEKPFVLFFGTININKGIEYLCEAMKQVFPKRPDLHLVVAGKGDYYFDITPYANDNRYHFIHRHISDEEQVSLLTNCEVVVCPYIDATQSGVVMSAFALDKPVIGTNVGGMAEMIEHGRHGILVPPRDVAALANAILDITSDDTLRSMSQHIHEDYDQGKRSWTAIAMEMKDIYQHILAEQS